jgi:hypothetical protein
MLVYSRLTHDLHDESPTTFSLRQTSPAVVSLHTFDKADVPEIITFYDNVLIFSNSQGQFQLEDYADNTARDADVALLTAWTGAVPFVTMPNINDVPLNYVVHVNSLADLPEPVGNVITLQNQTLYEFAPGPLNLGNNVLVCPQFCALRGQGTFITTFQSSVTDGDTFITSTNTGGVLHIDNIQVNFNDTNFTLFDVDGLEQLLITGCFFIAPGGDLGRIANINTTRFGLLGSLVGFSVGLEIDGFCGTVLFDRIGLVNFNSAPQYIYTTSTTSIGLWMDFAGCKGLFPAGTTGIYLDPATQFNAFNILPSGDHKFKIIGCDFDGGGLVFDGVTFDNPIIFNRANHGVEDSRASASYYFTTSSPTNFLDSAPAPMPLPPESPVKANGQTTLISSRGFIHNDNQLTYNVRTPIRVQITAVAYLTPTDGSTTSVSLFIAKNGVVIPNSECRVYTTDKGALAVCMTETTCSYNSPPALPDSFELYISNNTNADPVTVEIKSSKMSIVAL